MRLMLVTLDVSQDPIGWLKFEAFQNIAAMVVTLEVSQDPIGWLKAVALENMLDMSVTFAVFQPLKAELKVEPTKAAFKLVTVLGS